jgi:MerR family transcriptional regulator/heat shock protein HspR
MNLEGIRHVMSLEAEVERLRDEVEHLRRAVDEATVNAERRVRRDLVPLRQAIAVFGQRPSIFDQHS